MAYDAPAPAAKKRSRSKLDDEDFLNLLQQERRQSVGFEHDSILLSEREMALEYLKGEMSDMPSLANRSKAVSRDLSDAVETAMPDLMEIFTGGDDVLAFKPLSEQDEKGAEQESELVREVVFSDNAGFLTLYSALKDALELKVGVIKFWWEDKPIAPEDFAGKSEIEIAILAQSKDGQITDLEQDGTDPATGQPTYAFTLRNEEPGGSVCIASVPPEDFTVARDTVVLADTTYCAFRSRPRAQDLIAQGLSAEAVENLPPYGTNLDEAVNFARDQAGEHAEQNTIQGDHNLRTVEVIEHFIRVDADGDGAPEIWRVLTGGNETIVLEREEVDRIPFAAGTPYIIAHRFYGESLADRLMEIQRIKTALLRMMLDSGYFALNQRHIVADSGTNDHTITDLMRMEPGLPVRAKTTDAVAPIPSPGLGFDAFQAMEFVSVMGEQRTGIVRNAQGLNPDSLHETAQGMTQLMQAAQTRLRLLARVFAETMLKDLYLGVHALLRKHGHKTSAKFGNQWVPVDCSQWAERSRMTINVGLGSAGRAQEMAIMQMVVTLQEKIVQLQGGASGPLVDLSNIYAAVVQLAKKGGELGPERFFTLPQGPQPPKPDPAGAKAQADAQQAQAELQQKGQQEAAELQHKSAVEAEELKLKFMEAHDKDQRERLALQQEHERELIRLQHASDMKAAELDSKERLERAKLATQLEIAMITAKRGEDADMIRAQAELSRAEVDLEMQARDHTHDADMTKLTPAPDSTDGTGSADE